MGGSTALSVARRCAGFLPAVNPDGVDREAFHARRPDDVGEFLDGRLSPVSLVRHGTARVVAVPTRQGSSAAT